MNALLLPLVLLAAPTTNDWPHWRGPDRTGVSPESGWSTEGAEDALWRAEVGRGYSAPSIAGGRLYTRGFHVEDEKDGTDITVCLDALTGEMLWEHAAPAKLMDNMHGGGTLTTPTVDGDSVYVLSRNGMLWSLAAADGEVQWELNLTEELEVEEGFFGLASSPVVLGDELVVNVGVTLCVDKASGERRWATRDYGYSYGTPAPFQFGDALHLAVFNAIGLTVIDASDGSEVATHDWTSEYNVNSATPIVVGERIFISTGYNEKGGRMLELTEEGLGVVWSNRQMNNLMNGCVLVGDALYGFDRTQLRCLDLEGEMRWAKRGLGRGTVIASDERLIVLSEEGELLIGAASTEGFEEEYRRQVLDGGPCWTTPVLANGLIYCRSSSGELVCLDHRGER